MILSADKVDSESTSIKLGDRGRPPRGIEVMLRMYLVQSWFNLSDAMVEDAIYDSYAIRSFMGLNFHDEQAPDATTLLKFRRLLEEQEVSQATFHSKNYTWPLGESVFATYYESIIKCSRQW